MATDVDMEFDVQMKCEDCVKRIKESLDGLGIKNPSIDLERQSVLVSSHLPFSEVLKAIEDTGVMAVIKGIGGESPNRHKQEAAVAEINGENIKGVIRFLQANKSTCIIDGTIDGLSVGEHGLHIHEFGDLSNGFQNLGPHFDPGVGSEHGGLPDIKRHYGDLGNIRSDENQRAIFRIEDAFVKVYEIIGRSLAVCESSDDLGRGKNSQSKLDGNCGQTVAAAIIARSAGLFQNPKRICLCDGKSIWEEKKYLALKKNDK